jgi:hypothetical protein
VRVLSGKSERVLSLIRVRAVRVLSGKSESCARAVW